jgi:hypothetical protein
MDSQINVKFGIFIHLIDSQSKKFALLPEHVMVTLQIV